MADSDDMNSAWQIGVFDAHCHPTDIMSAIEKIPQMKARALTIMATRAQDQHLVADTARKYLVTKRSSTLESNVGQVVPSFGWHPWFAHQLFDDRDGMKDIAASEHYRSVLTPAPEDSNFLETLPPLISLSEFLNVTETRLNEFPSALVGEVGLDRAFRIPNSPESEPSDTVSKASGSQEGEFTPGSREGRSLTPYRVKMDHQKLILKAQLELAAKLQRPVSIHSVQAHGVVFEVLQELWKGNEKPSKRSQKKNKDVPNSFHNQELNPHSQPSTTPYPPRICMHSYSGPPDALKQYLATNVPADVYFSFSHLINFGSNTSSKAVDVIRAVPNDRILIESDLHCAGAKMDDLLREILERVCKIKGWTIKQGAEQLRDNWERFIFGN